MAIYSGFSHKKIVIFHSYVKLPEGTLGDWLILVNIASYMTKWGIVVTCGNHSRETYQPTSIINEMG